MTTGKLHHNEVDINADLIRRLLANQFPEWAKLDLTVIRPEGSDNAMYKLGNDKVLRLPRTESADLSLKKEETWLPNVSA